MAQARPHVWSPAADLCIIYFFSPCYCPGFEAQPVRQERQAVDWLQWLQEHDTGSRGDVFLCPIFFSQPQRVMSPMCRLRHSFLVNLPGNPLLHTHGGIYLIGDSDSTQLTVKISHHDPYLISLLL